MEKDKQNTETWPGFYDRGSILEQMMEEPVEFSIDRKLQNVSIKMDPLHTVTIRKLATMKSIAYKTLIRHWLSDKIRKELILS